MEVKIIDQKGKNILHISGEVDMYSSHTLRDKLMSLVKKKVPIIFVDLKDVIYMDSSGIATFVEGLKCLKKYGGRIKFYNVPRRIMDIFKFSRLDSVFEIYKNLEDAINK